MPSRIRTTARNSLREKTREDLAGRFPPAVVDELAGAAADYVERAARLAAAARELPRARSDAQRIRNAARRLLKVIQRSDRRVQFRMFALKRDLTRVVEEGGGRGRRRDEARYQLECAVGSVLHRHGIPLTLARGGKLARALQLVVGDVVGARLEDPMRSCDRVRQQVLAEAQGNAALDRIFRSGTK